MPSHLKQESDDVPGNKYVVSGQDVNKHDDEIRSIQSVIGVHLGDPTNPNKGTDVITTLANVIARLNDLRDNQVQVASGVVAVKDSSVLGVDGKIQFPTAWSVTTLASPIADSAVDDETLLPELSTVTLADVSGMPDEGYITIINDVSLAKMIVSKDNKLVLISPSNAYGKIGKAFAFSIDLIGDDSKVSSITMVPRAGQPTLLSIGLALNGTDIAGTPTADGTFLYDVLVKNAAGATLVSGALTIVIVQAGTPSVSAATVNARIGTAFSHSLPAVAVGSVGTTSPSILPAGISFYGPVGVGASSSFVLSGTPRVVGTTNIDVTVTDSFGDSSTATITLIVA